MRDHGMVDLVVPRGELAGKLASLIGLLMDGGAAKPASRKGKANGAAALLGKKAHQDEAGA